MTKDYYEEGDRCPQCKSGELYYQEVENCSCHISPPCSACVENPLECIECGWEEGDSIQEKHYD